MIDLRTVERNVTKAPRIVVYGVPGIGKTTFACSAPNPLVISVEDGLGTIPAHALVPTSFEDVLETCDALARQEHEFGSVVIDTIDRLEPMVWDYVCRQGGKENIEAFGFGKGYGHAAAAVRSELLPRLDRLRDRGMIVIVVAHSAVVRFEAPDSDGYDRYQLRLHKQVEPLIVEWADAVLFCVEQTRAVKTEDGRKRGISTGQRVMHTVERAAWRAKNRYSLPAEMPLEWSSLQAAIEAHVAGMSIPIPDDERPIGAD